MLIVITILITLLFIFFIYPQKVELEGFEPSSKRGNHTLSTCLSWTSFSCNSKTQATNCCLIL